MPTNIHFLLFIILILLPDSNSIFLKISLASEGESLVSDWRPIKNLSDTKVVDVWKFAVARHNFEAKSRLLFDELVYVEMKSRTGTDYNLTIAARDDGNTDDDNEPRNYVAIVSDKQFQDFMHLVSFRGPV